MGSADLQGTWPGKAMLCELLAKSLACPTGELACALAGGDYVAALRESCSKAGIVGAENLGRAVEDAYSGTDVAAIERGLRVEYTRLFVGTTKPAVSPYGSYWIAIAEGREPVLFLSRETQEVEAVMRAAGVGSRPGLKEPLDHIVCELEFLQYSYLVLCGVEPLPEGVVLDEADVASFVDRHVRRWITDFVSAVERETECTLYRVAASLLPEL